VDIGIIGTSLPVFIGLTGVLMGFAAYMTGQAVANTWKPRWHVVAYCLPMGLVDRFLTWGLFEGDGLLVTGYIIDTIVLLIIGLFSFQLNKARRMTLQYPWIYERVGLFSWSEKGGN